MTEFDTKCQILSDLWVAGDNGNLKDYFERNDVGLPLAFHYTQGMFVELTDKGQSFIEMSFDELLEEYGVEDTSVSQLSDITGS